MKKDTNIGQGILGSESFTSVNHLGSGIIASKNNVTFG